MVRQTLRPGDFVVVSTFIPLDEPFDEARLYSQLSAIDAAARDVGATLVIELPHIRSQKNARTCTREWFRTAYDGCSLSLAAMNASRREALDRVRSRLDPSVLTWDPLPLLCPDGQCAAVTNAVPVLRDHNHLAVGAARSLAPHFEAFLDRVGRRSP